MGTRVVSDFSDDCLLTRNNGGENTTNARRDLSFEHDSSLANLVPQRRQLQQTDQIQKLAGLSIGFCSMFVEQLLSHPCVVLRRQCQVHHVGAWYHLTPVSLIHIVINIQRTQGGVVLWKGLGSVYIVRGISIVSENVFSEITTFPSLVFAITTPFLAASLVETVQSDIASERPGVFDILLEGAARVGAWGAPQTGRQIPLWQLVLPTVIVRLSHYIVSSIAQFTVTSATSLEQQEIREQPGENGREPTVYETYFPELLASFTGGLLADIITFPLETVLHRLYVQGTRTIIDNTDTGLGVVPINTHYEGVVDCFRCVIVEEGLQGLYRGFGALILQYAAHGLILRLVKFLFEKLSDELGSQRPPARGHQDSPLAMGFVGQGFGYGEGFSKQT